MGISKNFGYFYFSSKETLINDHSDLRTNDDILKTVFEISQFLIYDLNDQRFCQHVSKYGTESSSNKETRADYVSKLDG